MSKTFSESGSYQNRMAEILFADAYYTYEFDVTTGVIGDEIIGSNGYNYTKAVSSCTFDEMVQRVLYGTNSNVEFTIDSAVQELSCKALMKAYQEGKRRVEVKLHSKRPNAYHRLTYLLDRDEESGHVIGSLGIEEYNAGEFDEPNLYGRELGYVLSKEHWGRGLMTDMICW